MNRKFVVSVLVMLVAVAGALAYYKYAAPAPLPDPKEQKPEDIAKLIVSDKFAKQTTKAKEAYLENLVNQEKTHEIFYSARSMSDDEKKALRDNMRSLFELSMKKTAKEYFSLPPEKKEAFLDEQLDRMEQRFAERQRQMEAQGGSGNPQGGGFFGPGGGGGGEPGGPGGGRRRQAPSPQQVKNRIESIDPESRAQIMQYRNAIRKRIQERTSN